MHYKGLICLQIKTCLNGNPVTLLDILNVIMGTIWYGKNERMCISWYLDI